VRKEDHVLPCNARMARDDAYGRATQSSRSMEQGRLRISVPNTPPKDPNYPAFLAPNAAASRLLFTSADETLGPMVMRVRSFFRSRPPNTSTGTASSSRS